MSNLHPNVCRCDTCAWTEAIERAECLLDGVDPDAPDFPFAEQLRLPDCPYPEAPVADLAEDWEHLS